MILKLNVKHSLNLFLISFNIQYLLINAVIYVCLSKAVAWEECFMCLWYRSLLVVCSLAVTYKRIVPRQRILHGVEPSYEPNRGNVSRKRKKPGAGMYKKNFIYRILYSMHAAFLNFDLKLFPTYSFLADFFF